jgi:hypothetical protein
MQVKRLVLGNVNTIINVATTKNEKMIAIEWRCKITLEYFWNVHAVTIQQLAMAEKQLKVTLQSIVLGFVQANPKDFARSSCKNINNIQVHFELSITQYGSNMVFSSVFQTELKALETNKKWVFNTDRFQMSKLKE